MYKITIPYNAVQLQFFDNQVLVPLSEHSIIRIDSSMERLVRQFENAIQSQILNRGFYNVLLELLEGGAVVIEKASITVDFPAAKDRFSYPKFDLVFDYFYKKTEKGIWAILPTLGLECFSEVEEQLEKNIKDSIKLEFARKRKLNAVQHILTSIWLQVVDLQKDILNFTAYTPPELLILEEKEKEKILPKVAQKLDFKKQITFGRVAELNLLANALKGKFNKSVLVVGKSGVGKTALIWEIARRAKEYDITAHFYETTASTMIKELTQSTGWQDNLVYLCRELSNEGNFLYIRNLLELFEVGQYEGNSVSMADYLRSFVGRGEVTIISECTDEELANIELRSPNFLSLFQIVRLEEPREDLETIITQKVQQISNTNKIVIEQAAIEETIRLNRRYTPYSGFPGKPIRFLESMLLSKKIKNESQENIIITKTMAIQHFCEETGMPEFMVNPEKLMDFSKVQQFFADNIFGQKAAVNSVTNLLAAVKTALTRQGKPIASFLFVGQTGIGKTEMAKVLADFMFGSRTKMIRFDMSEFSTPYAVQRLTGMSYFEDGLLTSAVKREPFCVLLFDEIEKADDIFYDLLLQLLSEGRLTDSQGKLVNFCSTIIIMTSNIGATNSQASPISWSKEVDNQSVNSHFLNAVQKHFRPELFNRIDEVIAFQPLAKHDIRYIVNREIKLFRNREGIRYRNIDFYLEEEVFDFLGEMGYDPKYGARKLQRVIRELLIIPLARKLNTFEYDEQLVVNITLWDKQLTITIESDPLKFDLLLENLEMYQYADYSGDLRRSLQSLKEGNFFVKLLSDLDILENKKRKYPETFWKNEKEAESYVLSMHTVQELEDLITEIETYEEELSMACMNLRPYNPRFIEGIKAWESTYFDYKVALFNRVNPQSNQAKFYLIGEHLDVFIQFYEALFNEKGYKYSAKLIWYQEAYFNEIIEENIVSSGENGTSESLIIKRKRESYRFTDFDLKSAVTFDNTILEDKLIGVEFTLTGSCPALFLLQESGLQEWLISNTLTARAFIFVESNNAPLAAKDLHSKAFWAHKKARRIYKHEHLWDSTFDINREITKNKFLDYLLVILNERFEAKLNEVLL